ncbi:hypothetical protein [Kordia zhangzhouensis]|uniref:hypothetical protein n=1 Tax=Kordia zhangzhouensis TaxID=1620405 RepID=UPI0006298D5D|nr:hypothetical protein [Kordia zhangzhouensis]
MKKIISLLCIVLCISCSSDDGPSQAEIVAGTYKLTSLIPNVPIDTNYDGSFITSDLIDIIVCDDFGMKLFGDGTISINLTNQSVRARREQYWTGSSSWDYVTYVHCSDIYDFEGTFVVSGNDIAATLEVISTEANPETFEMNFEINDDILTFVYVGAFITSDSTDAYDFRDVEFTAVLLKE